MRLDGSSIWLGNYLLQPSRLPWYYITFRSHITATAVHYTFFFWWFESNSRAFNTDLVSANDLWAPRRACLYSVVFCAVAVVGVAGDGGGGWSTTVVQLVRCAWASRLLFLFSAKWRIYDRFDAQQMTLNLYYYKIQKKKKIRMRS